MHKCQGTSQLLLLPGAGSNRTYRLMDSIGGDPGIAPASMFEDIDTTIPGLARFAPSLAATLSPSLKAIAARITEATAAFESKGPAAAAPALAAGLANVRALRSRLKSGNGISADAFEVEFRLAQKETQFQQALVLASGARLESLASDGLVIPGQTVEIASYVEQSGGRADHRQKYHGGAPRIRSSVVRRIASTAARPSRARDSWSSPRRPFSPRRYWKPRTDAARYDFAPGVPFGVPFTPTPFTTTFELTIAGADISIARPVEYRYDHIVAGEKRMELQVVPPFAMTMTPAIAVVPAAAAARRTVEVTVTNHTTGAVSADVSLRVPAGWRSEPESAPVKFSREDEQAAVSFVVVPPAGLKSGEHQVSALVRSESLQSTVGYEVVEYPHIRRRHVVQPAEARLKVIDVAIAANLRVGYIMGVGDQVPPAIEQLGAEVHQITPKELASGDLSRYHTIVTGVRAYERRPDLRANNHRLLSYASNGGTVLVQYNKFEFNEAQYAPYPAKVSSGRVTDENSVVEILVPDHPAFTRPNRIGEAAWKGWVQERGLYFLGERDPAYRDLIRLEDPFPLNKGSKTGALVEAKVGKGRWIYIGLGLWRQLPAGADGAYQLMANLLSLGSPR